MENEYLQRSSDVFAKGAKVSPIRAGLAKASVGDFSKAQTCVMSDISI